MSSPIASLVMLVRAPKAEAACTLSATAVAFGPYDVFQAVPTHSTGTITYRCDNNDRGIRIAISTGTSGTFANRALKNGTENLLYNLFLRRLHSGLGGRHRRDGHLLRFQFRQTTRTS